MMDFRDPARKGIQYSLRLFVSTIVVLELVPFQLRRLQN